MGISDSISKVTKKFKLKIELIPASSWNQNLRSLLKKDMWENLRKKVYNKYNYRCAICGSDGQLHAHEVWKYDDENHIQRLKNIVALCQMCHLVKHIGFASLQSNNQNTNYEKVVKHFMKVNSCDRITFQKHYDQAIKKFEERSRYEWLLDLHKLKNEI